MSIAHKQLTHDRLAKNFDQAINAYDTSKRIEVLFSELISDRELQASPVLEIGCGAGHFSVEASQRGADLVAFDLGANLLKETQKKANCQVLRGDALKLPFEDESWGAIISSECIEHTPNPAQALQEMGRVLKPGGVLALTMPCRTWWPVIQGASVMGWRPFNGYENFFFPHELRKHCHKAGLEVQLLRGIHLFPFQLKWLWGLLEAMDRVAKHMPYLTINLAIRAIKKGSA